MPWDQACTLFCRIRFIIPLPFVVRAHLVSQDYGRIVHIWLGSAHCIDCDYVPI